MAVEIATTMTSEQKAKKPYLTSILLLSAVFTGIYYIVNNPTLNGTLNSSLLADWYFTGIILLVITIKLAAHLIRIKLIFWRIFLQTFLNTSSRIYKFFVHGYMVRLIALLLAAGLAIKIYIFFAFFLCIWPSFSFSIAACCFSHSLR